ncbi:MAG: GNAT family N-acetyltransferase, partial [Deltaproteobacteria bacterium]|nr:GNAT family N-acetyltransferase [Deltaproteobacteria bacterium]
SPPTGGRTNSDPGGEIAETEAILRRFTKNNVQHPTYPSIVGTEASARFMNIIRFVEAFHQRFAADRHLYLQWLGVEPSRQGQGLGKRNDHSGIAAR